MQMGQGGRLPPQMMQASSSSPIKFVATMAGLVVAIIVGLTLLFGSWYTVDQTERGVLLRNGAFVEVVQPGLRFKMPWIEAVYKLDMQTHTYSWSKVNS